MSLNPIPFCRAVLLVLALSLIAGGAMAQAPAQQPDQAATGLSQLSASDAWAQVRVDGKVLFRVRGISAYPAPVRAKRIADRIEDFADATERPVESIRFEMMDDGGYRILADDEPLLSLYPFDAELEAIPLPILTEVAALRIQDSVRKYRADRSPDALQRSALVSVALTLGGLLLVFLLARLRRWLDRTLRARVDARMADLERKSGSAVHRAHFWGLARGLVRSLWVIALLVLAYFYLSSVLGTFPWTRGFALRLLDYVRDPLVAMGAALVRAIPDLMFLLVLWFVVRYLLRTLRAFFEAIDRRRVRLTNFEPEWALPTYRLLRIAVVAFALVVAYPYIPGSESAAFKGVSLFLGIIVSLGSTSFISNLIAGIALTYRGVFREGDWVEIDGAEGRVEEIKAQVVRLRTRDNERISIPSSTILTSNVTNLSEQADSQGLVLRCRIGLGYDVDWKQAEALMLAAAKGVEGVLAEPAPFVQINDLGDFAVDYTLRVRIADPGPLPAIRTALNQAILDQFHAAGVQIMSPAYENDPATPKIPGPRPEGD